MGSYIDLLSEEQLAALKKGVLKILSSIGVKVEDETVRAQFAAKGCGISGDRVLLNAELVEEVCSASVGRIVMSRGGYEFVLENGIPHTHPTGGCPWIIDADGTRRNACHDDLVKALKLMNGLENLDLSGTLLYPSDIPGYKSEYLLTETLFRYSRKPVLTTSISIAETAQYAVDVIQLFAGREGTYSGIASVSPESPLSLPKKITDILRTVVSAGIPVLLLPAPMAGLTGPATVTGTVAQGYAEFLATAAYCYLVRPAVPVLMGSRTFFANMKNAHTILGLPETGISSAMCCQLARRDGFLADTYGLCCTAIAPDEQAGYEKVFNSLLPAMGGAALITGLGSLASVMCGSLGQLVIDNDIFGMTKRCFRGFGVDEESLGLEAIESVVLEDSTFLIEPHTLDYIRSGEAYAAHVGFDRMPADEDTSESTLLAEAFARAEQLIAEDETVPLPDDVEKELSKIRESADRKLG